MLLWKCVYIYTYHIYNNTYIILLQYYQMHYMFYVIIECVIYARSEAKYRLL